MTASFLDVAKKNLGLTSDDKLNFRATTLQRLAAGPPIVASASSYWSAFFTIFDTPSDVPTLITSADLRQALREQPENVATLIRVLSRRLAALVEHGELFADQERADRLAEANQRQGWRGLTRAVPKGLKEGAAGLIGAGGVPGATRGKMRELLNCVRVLARVLPFVMESADGEADIISSLLWGTPPATDAQPPSASSDAPLFEASHFVIEDDEEDAPAQPSTASPSHSRPPEPQASTDPPLAISLLTTVLSLLFLPGVTVPAPEFGSPRVLYPIWAAGVGAPTSPPIEHSTAHDAAKAEVLRLLLVLLSEPLYHPPHLFAAGPRAASATHDVANPMLVYLVQETPRKLSLALLCSLLNTVLAAAPKGSSSLSLAGLGHLAKERIGRRSGAEHLPAVCAQVLGVLLLPSPAEPAPTPDTPYATPQRPQRPGLDRLASSAWSIRTVAPPSSASPGANVFRFYVSKLHRKSDFHLLLDGLMATLTKPMAATTQLLPDSTDHVAANVKESLLLLYLSTDSNPRFMSWLVSASGRASDVVVMLLFYCLEHKGSPAQIGLVRLCAVLLQLLTAETGLAASLNAGCDLPVSLKSKYGVPGTTADFVVVSICSLVFSTRGALGSLYPSLVVCLTNISPYVEGLSALASTRLVQLFLAFSAPSFVLAEDANVRLVYYLLEAFNNIIHYRLRENPQVTYALVRAHQRFDHLANFTLSEAVREIRRKKAAKEREAAAAAAAAEEAGQSSKPRRRRASSALSMSIRTPSLSRHSSEAEKQPLTAGDEEEDGQEREGQQPLSPEGDPNNLTAPPEVEDLATTAAGARPMSEKARGKMRRTSSLGGGRPESLDGEGGEEGGRYVGRNGFVPTEGWVASWRDSLPLDTVQIMLTELKPKVSSLAAVSSPSTNQAVIDFLETASLDGLLPPPPPRKARRFTATPGSLGWLGALTWSLVFVGDADYFSGANVQLFGVRKEQRTGMGLSALLTPLATNLNALSPFGGSAQSNGAGGGGEGQQGLD